jgi:hypothetical protein
MENLPHYNFSWTVSLQKQRNTSLKVRLEEALFGELSLEEAVDFSRDRLILELDIFAKNSVWFLFLPLPKIQLDRCTKMRKGEVPSKLQ